MVGHLQVRTQSLVNTVYLNYFQIPLLYFATTLLHLRKKNIETKSWVKNYDTKGHTIVSKLFLNRN